MKRSWMLPGGVAVAGRASMHLTGTDLGESMTGKETGNGEMEAVDVLANFKR